MPRRHALRLRHPVGDELVLLAVRIGGPPVLADRQGVDQCRVRRAGFLAVLAALAGAVWTAAGNPAWAQVPDAWAWPDTDFDKALVDLAEITSGGPPKDGIPPIDAPEFDDAGAAARWLDPREPVIVLTAGGETRAYPLQILIWHEIVNDTVGGVPVSVT